MPALPLPDKTPGQARFFPRTALAGRRVGRGREWAHDASERVPGGHVEEKWQFLIDGLSAVHSEFVRISFTKTDNPGKPGPVLITSQTSKDHAGVDNYRYLLQPNLLLR